MQYIELDKTNQPLEDYQQNRSITCYTGKKRMKKNRPIYTFEECKEETSKFNNKTSFKVQSGSIYSFAYKLGWLNDICSHMPEKKKINGYWTKEECLIEANKHQTKAEFIKSSPSAHSIAKRNGWLKECYKHMRVVGSKVKRAIYVFEFLDNHAYVGLTYDLEVRKNQHITSTNSAVYKHFQQTASLYKFKQLTEYLEIEEAVKQEAYYIEKYSKEGWNLLNSRCAGATGGSTLIWNFDKCLEEALEYEKRKEFKEKAPSAYGSARKNKWLDEICSHMKPEKRPANYWTKENIIKEMTKYKTRSDFNKNSGGAALVARGYDWYDELWELAHKVD